MATLYFYGCFQSYGISIFNTLLASNGQAVGLYGGAGLIASYINLGLIDNFLLAVYPVILGDGKPLFSYLRDRVALPLNRVVSSGSGVFLLDYDTIGKGSL